jgi:hypothetical protein
MYSTVQTRVWEVSRTKHQAPSTKLKYFQNSTTYPYQVPILRVPSTLHLLLWSQDLLRMKDGDIHVGDVPGILHVQTAYLGTATHDVMRILRRGQCRGFQIWRRAARYCENFSFPKKQILVQISIDMSRYTDFFLICKEC